MGADIFLVIVTVFPEKSADHKLSHAQIVTEQIDVNASERDQRQEERARGYVFAQAKSKSGRAQSGSENQLPLKQVGSGLLSLENLLCKLVVSP